MGLFSRVPRTTPAELAERLAAREVHVIDVRRPAEWRQGHIAGSQNVPLARVSDALRGVPAGKAIVTVCASGHRSAAAARVLARAGREAQNLRGGMLAWARAGLPVARGR